MAFVCILSFLWLCVRLSGHRHKVRNRTSVDGAGTAPLSSLLVARVVSPQTNIRTRSHLKSSYARTVKIDEKLVAEVDRHLSGGHLSFQNISYDRFANQAQAQDVEASEVQMAFDVVMKRLRNFSHSIAGTIKFDPKVAARCLSDMGLARCSPLLAVLPSDLVDGARGPASESMNAQILLSSIARNIDANPILLSALKAFPSRDMCQSPEDDIELYRVIHHCLVIDLVTAACLRDPVLAEQVYSESRNTFHDTETRLSIFEHFKVCTVERSLDYFTSFRSTSTEIPALFGLIGLPFNILEAMVQDLFFGRISNGYAGIPLVLAPPGESPASVSGADRMVNIHMPLPKEWQHLYISWNLAFTCNYADAPYFAAALLAPSVAGASPEKFILARAYSLYLQIVAHLRRRGTKHKPCSPVQGKRDWRDEQISKAWGDTNAIAAESFWAKLEASRQRKGTPRLARTQLKRLLYRFAR